MSVRFINNTDSVMFDFGMACIRALERCGSEAEGYAVDLAPVDTGALRNSITHALGDGEVYIGTNMEYAPYVELGTGKYYPGGRPTPWMYEDAKGDMHWTAGNKAQPFIKPAVADHVQTYKNIIKGELTNG